MNEEKNEIFQEEDIEVIELFNNWLTDSPDVNDWDRNHSNYCGIATMNSDGELKKKYCSVSKDSDLYFNVSEVKEGDILMCGWLHERKKRGSKLFYLVLKKDDNQIQLLPHTTYLKATKTKKKLETIETNR